MNETVTPALATPPVFGMRLRAARESKHLSLQDVANRLRLNTEIVHTLETGDYPQTPPPLFMRGYLRAYGHFLGFSEKEIHGGLAESGLTIETGILRMSHPGPAAHSAVSLSRLQWTGGILLLLMLLAAFSWENFSLTTVREKFVFLLPGTLTGHLTTPPPPAFEAPVSPPTDISAIAAQGMVDPTPPNPAISPSAMLDVPLVLPEIPEKEVA